MRQTILVARNCDEVVRPREFNCAQKTVAFEVAV